MRSRATSRACGSFLTVRQRPVVQPRYHCRALRGREATMWRGSEDAGLRGVWRTANALTVTSRRSNDILACPDRSMPALATGYRVRLALDRPIPDVRRRALTSSGPATRTPLRAMKSLGEPPLRFGGAGSVQPRRTARHVESDRSTKRDLGRKWCDGGCSVPPIAERDEQ